MRNGIVYVLAVAAFGIAVPAVKGLGFLDPVLLSAYACLGVIFSGPAAAQAFEKRPESLRQAMRWIAKAVFFAEAVAIAMLVLGIGTVYAMHRAAFFPPDLESLGFAVLLGAAGSLAVAELAAWIALAFSAGAARTAMRLVFLGLLALFYLRGRWLPSVIELGALYSMGAAAVLALLLTKRLAAAR